MGNMSEMRGLVVVFSFIGCLMVLLSTFPVGFKSSGVSAQNVTTGESFPELMAWNSSTAINMTTTNAVLGLFQDVGGWHFQFTAEPITGLFGFIVDWWIRVETYDNWWLSYRVNFEGMDWTRNGIVYSTVNRGIKPATLDAIYTAHGITHLQFLLKNSRTKLNVQLVFNETKYSKPSEALAGDGLSFVVNVSYDDRNTSTDAFGFINTLINPFQGLPNVPNEINLLIKLPIWVGMGYILFIAILRIIGSVFGGGGA